MNSPASSSRISQDPRPLQIAIRCLLLGYGVLGLDFEVDPIHAGGMVAAALGTQLLCTWLWRLPRFDPQSAVLSGLSLALLLRSSSLSLAFVAGALAISSKFLLRWNGKHLFNPSCFALVAMMAATDGAVWVSAGQWGSAALFALAVIAIGVAARGRNPRSDVTWAFLGFWSAIVLARAAWLGDPIAIPLHTLQNGALLVFAFFVISDPKTIPDSRPGRIVFAALVAAGAGMVDYAFFRTNALLWSLALLAPVVPILDRFLPGENFSWRSPAPLRPIRVSGGFTPPAIERRTPCNV